MQNTTHDGSSLTIIVGVTGGIAAYKAVALIRLLVRDGHRVHVVATHSALKFIGKPTFEAISRHPVIDDLFADAAEVPHVKLAQNADLVVVAPATAHSLAKMAGGLAEDVLDNVILATTAPIVVAPAMHTEMWENQATTDNVATLRKRNFHIIEPAVGPLTGEDIGPGRLEEPEVIAERSLAIARSLTQGERGVAQERAAAQAEEREETETDGERFHGDFSGRRVVVTAGGTREPLDPVRFLGNRSSGKQGVAIALAAARRGAEVTLITAHLEVDAEAMIDSRSAFSVLRASSADDMARAVQNASMGADVIVMAAAVADYRPIDVSQTKVKKNRQGQTMTVELERTPDILTELVTLRTPKQVVVGFAAETIADRDELLKAGKSKARVKGADFLVVNSVGWDEGFSTDDNTVMMLDERGAIVMEASGTKAHVADRILDVCAVA